MQDRNMQQETEDESAHLQLLVNGLVFEKVKGKENVGETIS